MVYLFNTHEDTNPRSLLNSQIAGYLERVLLGDIPNSKVRGGGKYNQDNIGLNLDLDLVLTDPKTAYANSNIQEGTLIVITFDEADYDATGYDTNYDGPNQIYTVLLGYDHARHGDRHSTQPLQHDPDGREELWPWVFGQERRGSQLAL